MKIRLNSCKEYSFVRRIAGITLKVLALYFLVAGVCALQTFAAGISHAPASRLASGSWVKISVSRSGLHFLSNRQLASMGFTDPSKVGVYGYGGQRLSDILDPDTYIDDIPAAKVHRTPQGIYFYGAGPEQLVVTPEGRFKYVYNPFSTLGYYFLGEYTEEGEGPELTTGYPEILNGSPVTTFTRVLQHEVDIVSPGETGHYMVGEDLKYTPSRSFGFELIDREGGEVWVGASVMTNLVGGAAWTLDATGAQPKITAAPLTVADSYMHGDATTAWIKAEDAELNSITAKVSMGGGSANTRVARLDWVVVNYRQKISLGKTGVLLFHTSSRSVEIAGATAATIVWDVTDPADIRRVNVSAPDTQGRISFSSNQDGLRHYMAFNPDVASGASDVPVYVGKVANQNLHAHSGIEMVIFTTAQSANAARQLAEHRRRHNNMNVEVVEQGPVFNEFASGMPDVNAFRKYLKMLYDRAKSGDGVAPRYVLLMGRSSFDNRRLSASVSAFNYDLLPCWQTDEGLNDNTTFPTDDIIAFLDDYSGKEKGNDTLCVAIGRIPVTSQSQAALIVNKIIEYETASPTGAWRNRGVFIADDDDEGVHMQQTEDMISAIDASVESPFLFKEKIYLDDYDYVNGIAVAARNDFYRILDEGALWVNYIGHASSTALSGEGILNYTDVGSLYLRKLPFIYAATCDFMRWDGIDISGAEMLASTKGGGVIGVLSATRPVYIARNGMLTNRIGAMMLQRENDGSPLALGQIVMKAKNSLGNDENKLRYALLGDPAMKLLMPGYKIIVDSIDGQAFPAPESDIVLQARQDLEVTGHVEGYAGNEEIRDFRGTLYTTLYDALESHTTQGHGQAGVNFTFDSHGMRLFAGADTVADGRFRAHIAMPRDVADNYRHASLVMYAHDPAKGDAALTEDRLYVFGTVESSVEDTVPPVIEYMYLNHPDFVNGKVVNSSPVLMASVWDNHAINMSLAGIGHWMSLSLDNGAATYNDISTYYEPESLQGGKIYYPLPSLDNGAHTLTLRIWDVAGNSTSRTISFYVDSHAPIKVYDIYTDSSPATATANFYLVHDRPDAELKVEFMIYDLMGRTVWTNTSVGRADRYTTFPITWNLTDGGGRRVQRGIYLYRAVVSEMTAGATADYSAVTPTKKLAVTAR